MAEQRGKFVERVSIEYALNGESLTNATRKSMEDWKKLHKHAKAFSIEESKKTLKALEAQAKTTTFRIEKDRRAEVRKTNKAILKDEIALQRKIAAAKKKNQAADDKNSVSGGFKNFKGKIGTIASYGAAIAIINALRQAVTYMISKAIEMESAFTDLAVKSGYTDSQLSKVADTVLNVAASTRFSTIEIVEAATALGKLGFEAEEVVEILPAVGNVAAATGESLQATAEVFGKVLNAYELTADSATNIADRLVDVFNNSALSLEKFNTAFSYVGSAAASTGTSFNELTAAMAVLSDRGITASKIGTGLRNVFTKLGTEGDSLRDILERISDAHLSFYEVAELVGRRAANQLFIMANSLDEFDENVARSTEDFGESMKAAAIQMDTFKSKWDILINTITNTVIPEFDEDETWRDGIKDSIDWLDKLNIAIDRTDLNKETKLDNLVAQYPEFAKDFKEAKKLYGENLDDREILSKMITEQLSKNKGEVGSKETATIGSLVEIQGLLNTFSEDFSLSDAIGSYDQEEVKAKLNQAEIDFTNFVKKTVSGIDANLGNEKRTDFLNGFLFGGDFDKTKKVLDEQLKLRQISVEEHAELLKGVSGKDLVFVEKLQKQYQVYAKENLLDALVKQYENSVEAVNLLTNGTGKAQDDSDALDKENIRKKIEKRVKDLEALCDLNPKYVSETYGIDCDPKKVKAKKGEIGAFEKNTTQEAEYLREKDLLNKQYRNEDDPEQKLVINDKLIALEKLYRSQLMFEYQKYYKDMGDARDAFVKKYPDQAGQYDDAVDRAKKNQVKDETSRVLNENTYNNRGLDARAEVYKRDKDNKQQYLLDIAKIDLKIKNLGRDDFEGKKALNKERNKVTTDYYLQEEQNLSLHYEKLQVELKKIEEANKLALADPDKLGSTLDTTKLKAEISKLKSELLKLRTENVKNQKADGENGGGDPPTEPYDAFPDIMQAYDDVYNVYAQIGDMKLEMIKEQNERELALISERYENEKGIVDASLQAGIVSQEQAQEANERLRRKKIDAENKANKTLFEAQKKRDKEEAIFTGISATAQAIAAAFARDTPVVATVMAAISAAAISASTAMNIGAIGKRKFVPQKYADGGLIEGRSHSQGGVPFTVSGYGGFEAEGGEYIVNKEATRNNLAELERINGKTRTGKRKYATGGIVSADDVNSNGFNEALLEALNRPVRAYVTDQDLSKSESERNALSLKTSY